MAITLRREVDKIIYWVGFVVLILNFVKEMTNLKITLPPWLVVASSILVFCVPIYLVFIDPIRNARKKEEMKEALKEFEDYFNSEINLQTLKTEAEKIQSILRSDLKPEVKKIKLDSTFIGIPIRLSYFYALKDLELYPEHKQKEIYLCSISKDDGKNLHLSGVGNLALTRVDSNFKLEGTDYIAWSYIFKDLIESDWKQLFVETTFPESNEVILRSVLRKNNFLLIYTTDKYSLH